MTFEEFTVARLPALMRFAVVLTRDPGLAEDIVQEVLIRAYRRWSRIARYDVPEAYIRRMVVNEYLSWRRRWWRLVPQAEPAVPGAVPDPAAAHAERDALLAELRQLPPRQHAVLVLRYYADMSDQQIAETLGCSVGTIRGYASRAFAALRIELGRAPAFIEEE